jgi:hypothetical protein
MTAKTYNGKGKSNGSSDGNGEDKDNSRSLTG